MSDKLDLKSKGSLKFTPTKIDKSNDTITGILSYTNADDKTFILNENLNLNNPILDILSDKDGLSDENVKDGKNVESGKEVSAESTSKTPTEKLQPVNNSDLKKCALEGGKEFEKEKKESKTGTFSEGLGDFLGGIMGMLKQMIPYLLSALGMSLMGKMGGFGGMLSPLGMMMAGSNMFGFSNDNNQNNANSNTKTNNKVNNPQEQIKSLSSVIKSLEAKIYSLNRDIIELNDTKEAIAGKTSNKDNNNSFLPFSNSDLANAFGFGGLTKLFVNPNIDVNKLNEMGIKML